MTAPLIWILVGLLMATSAVAELPAELSSGRGEAAAASSTVRKLQTITIPEVDFRQAHIEDVRLFLQGQSRTRDPEGMGIAILVARPGDTRRRLASDKDLSGDCPDGSASYPDLRVSLNVSNAPLGVVLKRSAEQIGYECKVDGRAVILAPVASKTSQDRNLFVPTGPGTFQSLTTVRGIEYRDVTVVSIEGDRLRWTHSTGGGKVSLDEFPDAVLEYLGLQSRKANTERPARDLRNARTWTLSGSPPRTIYGAVHDEIESYAGRLLLIRRPDDSIASVLVNDLVLEDQRFLASPPVLDPSRIAVDPQVAAKSEQGDIFDGAALQTGASGAQGATGRTMTLAEKLDLLAASPAASSQKPRAAGETHSASPSSPIHGVSRASLFLLYTPAILGILILLLVRQTRRKSAPTPATTHANPTAEQPTEAPAVVAPESEAAKFPASARVQRAAQTVHDAIADLERLAALRSQGVLTDDEFAAQKARVLTSQSTPPRVSLPPRRVVGRTDSCASVIERRSTPAKGARARSAAVDAVCWTVACCVIGPLVGVLLNGGDFSKAWRLWMGPLFATPFVFAAVWIWGMFAKREPAGGADVSTPTASMPASAASSQSPREAPSARPSRWNYVGIVAGAFMLLCGFVPGMVSGTLPRVYYLGGAFWIGVIVFCSMRLLKARV